MTTLSPLRSSTKSNKRSASCYNVSSFREASRSAKPITDNMPPSDIRASMSGLRKIQKKNKKLVFKMSKNKIRIKAASRLRDKISRNMGMQNELADKMNYFYKPYNSKLNMESPLPMKFEEMKYGDMDNTETEADYDKQAKQNWKMLSDVLLKDDLNFGKFLERVNSPTRKKLRSGMNRLCLTNRRSQKKFKGSPKKFKGDNANYVEKRLAQMTKTMVPNRGFTTVSSCVRSPEPKIDKNMDYCFNKTSFNNLLVTPHIHRAFSEDEMNH